MKDRFKINNIKIYLNNFMYAIPPLTRRLILLLASIRITKKATLTALQIISSKFKGVQLIKIRWLDQAHENIINEFSPNTFYTSIGHKNISGVANSVRVNVPAIRLYEFHSAIVTCDSSHPISKHNIYVERVPTVLDELADYRGGVLFEHNKSLALIKKKTKQAFIDGGFFLAGNGASNYYHWLIEIIPKIFFLKSQLQEKKINILISHKVKQIKNFEEILQKATIGLDASFTYLEQETQYLVQNLQLLTTPNILPFNLRGTYFKPEYCIFQSETINYIRKLGLDYSIESKFEYPKKIYLARRGTIRDYNQEEIILILKKYGYIQLYVEDYSFCEQAHIFNNAKYIIGPTGAAWTNLIFASKGTKAYCWMAKEVGDFSAFSNLANYSGVDLTYNYYSASIHNIYRSNYHIEIELLLNQLRQLEML